MEMQYHEFHLYLICTYPLPLALLSLECFLCISELTWQNDSFCHHQSRQHLRLLKQHSDYSHLGGTTILKVILTPRTLGSVPRETEEIPAVIQQLIWPFKTPKLLLLAKRCLHFYFMLHVSTAYAAKFTPSSSTRLKLDTRIQHPWKFNGIWTPDSLVHL